MTNFEKYKDVILEISKNGDRVAIDKCTGALRVCRNINCDNCALCTDSISCTAPLMLWLYEEYQEPPIDWSTFPVDTKVLVSNDGEKWHPRHFAKYENGRVYTWVDGGTSWSADVPRPWNYAKLAEEDAE